jgi:ubiquinone/menaquinone biosynthesis C-methylase UbiE
MSEFDQKAKEWDKNQMHIERTMAVAKQLIEMVAINPNMKAMEFGTGTGLLSFYLKDLFSEITLMDSSLEMLKMAEQKMEPGDHLKFKALFFDLEKDDYKGDPFDIVYSQMVIHHIRDIKAIFRKFYHLLRPGGILAIADLYKEDGSFHDEVVDVHPGFDPAKLKLILEEQDFNNITFNPCFIIRKENAAKEIREYPVFLLMAKKQIN